MPAVRKESYATSHAIENAHTVVLDEAALEPWDHERPAASFFCDEVAELRTLTAGDLIDPATKNCEWCGTKLRRSPELRRLEFGENPNARKWAGKA